MTPSVTVIMPVYNTAGFVAAALDSVLDQSFGDFELIIIDDASTDGSLKEIHRALGQRPAGDVEKVQIIDRDRNMGYGASLITGTQRARGNWTWCVDSDDTACPDMLQRLIDTADEHQADIVMSQIQTVNAATVRQAQLPQRMPSSAFSSGTDALRSFLRGDIVGFMSNKLISIELWDGVVVPTANAYADMVVMSKLLARAQYVAYVDALLFNYTLRCTSETGALKPSVWDLTTIYGAISPLISGVFSAREVSQINRHFVYRQVYWPLTHKAACAADDSALGIEIGQWARGRTQWADLAVLAASGRFKLAASLALAKASPKAHLRLFRYYKGRTS